MGLSAFQGPVMVQITDFDATLSYAGAWLKSGDVYRVKKQYHD
jgi:hypothetical protein